MPRILVVDDDDQIRAMLRLTLEREGHVIDEAADGNQALARYAAEPADLVIMDIVMPEKEGIETIMELRRTYRDVKIIAISGGGRVNPEDYLRWARTFGVQHTFAKPVDRNRLLDAVDELAVNAAL
ncbi:MAG: response regulator [Candidatus Krumholzibacteriia bacterium]